MSIPSLSNQTLCEAYTGIHSRCSDAVIRALEEQNAPLSDKQQANLEMLRSGNAVCAVTGQQLGLFLGPLFTYFKTASVLAWSQALTEQLGKPVVPIFWLQSEDHDLAEAASLSVAMPDETIRDLALFSDNERRSNRVSVGELRFPQDIADFRETIAAAAGVSVDHPELAKLCAHFRPGRSFSEAFTAALNQLFAAEGLLVFDCRLPELRKQSAPLLETLLDRQSSIADALAQRTRDLETDGFHHLVKLRNSPLFFIHPDGPGGPRFRLEASDVDRWRVEDGSHEYSTAELREKFRSSPECFSSSALMRPLLQNTLLPVLAYVAGPAESEYWRQLSPLWPLVGVAGALVLPRLRGILLEPKALRFLNQLGLTPADLDHPLDFLRAAALGGSLPPELRPDEVEKQLRTNPLAALIENIRRHDQQLAAELHRSAEKIERAEQGFLDKFREVLSRREETRLDKLARLTALTHPRGAPQERVCAFAPFWCKYSERLLPDVLAAFRAELRDAETLRLKHFAFG